MRYRSDFVFSMDCAFGIMLDYWYSLLLVTVTSDTYLMV